MVEFESLDGSAMRTFPLLLLACLAPAMSMAQFRVVDTAQIPPSAVPGAILLALYEGRASAPGHSSTVCTGTEFVVANQNGEFRLSGDPRTAFILVHKAGLVRPTQGATAEKGNYHLRSGASIPDQVRHFSTLMDKASCDTGEAGIVKFLQALLADIRLLPASPQRQGLIERAERDIKEYSQ